MRIQVLCIILILINLFSKGSSFGRRRISKCRRKVNRLPVEESIFHDPIHHPDTTVDDHHYDCGPTGFSMVQKIPYAQTCSGCNTIDINFSSVCIRCGMCSAIAHGINITLLDVHDMMPDDMWLNNTEAKLLLRTICNDSFRLYGLHEINGKRYISDNIPGAVLLSTSANGLWGHKLRELCHEYLDEVGELQLYGYWRRWYEDDDMHELTTILCRNPHGTLRDCNNMEIAEQYEPSYSPYYVKMKLTGNWQT